MSATPLTRGLVRSAPGREAQDRADAVLQRRAAAEDLHLAAQGADGAQQDLLGGAGDGLGVGDLGEVRRVGGDRLGRRPRRRARPAPPGRRPAAACRPRRSGRPRAPARGPRPRWRGPCPPRSAGARPTRARWRSSPATVQQRVLERALRRAGGAAAGLDLAGDPGEVARSAPGAPTSGPGSRRRVTMTSGRNCETRRCACPSRRRPRSRRTPSRGGSGGSGCRGRRRGPCGRSRSPGP